MEPILPFITAGDASLASLPELLAEFAALGVGTLELGLAHSDPVADGPVLQAAAQRAMGAGATPRRGRMGRRRGRLRHGTLILVCMPVQPCH